MIGKRFMELMRGCSENVWHSILQFGCMADRHVFGYCPQTTSLLARPVDVSWVLVWTLLHHSPNTGSYRRSYQIWNGFAQTAGIVCRSIFGNLIMQVLMVLQRSSDQHHPLCRSALRWLAHFSKGGPFISDASCLTLPVPTDRGSHTPTPICLDC